MPNHSESAIRPEAPTLTPGAILRENVLPALGMTQKLPGIKPAKAQLLAA